MRRRRRKTRWGRATSAGGSAGRVAGWSGWYCECAAEVERGGRARGTRTEDRLDQLAPFLLPRRSAWSRAGLSHTPTSTRTPLEARATAPVHLLAPRTSSSSPNRRHDLVSPASHPVSLQFSQSTLIGLEELRSKRRPCRASFQAPSSPASSPRAPRRPLDQRACTPVAPHSRPSSP